MKIVSTALNNFLFYIMNPFLLDDIPDGFILNESGILRRIVRPMCPNCGKMMVKNGSNRTEKQGLGSVKMGKWLCKKCEVTFTEDSGFFKKIVTDFMGFLAHMTMLLRTHQVSWEGGSEILSMIYPRGKETTRKMFIEKIKGVSLPKVKNLHPFIIHYDEQHPKRGRHPKYRLTLLDGETGLPIAEELFDDLTSATIKVFLKKHLDPNKPTFIVTDMAPGYPNVFKAFFKNKFYHQYCLLHLNKLICSEYSRNCSLKLELLKYEFLNIFYDRTREIDYLKALLKEERTKKGKPGYKKWVKKVREGFRIFLRSLENERRRKKVNLTQREYCDSVHRFNELVERYHNFPNFAQKRLHTISRDWENLTMFHRFENAPATNNKIENYYSTSLKTDKKKQYRTDEGIENHMKLSRLKRSKAIIYRGPTLFHLFMRFIPFRDCG